MLNYLKIYGDVLARMLPSGERPLALQHYTYVPGHEDLGQAPPRLGDEIIDIAVGWHSQYFQGLADRLVSGQSLVGWPGCDAQTLARTTAREGGTLDLLVTDRRLLVVDVGTLSVPGAVLWSRERSQVVTIRRAARFGQAGRIWVVLADGSAVALMLGLLNPGPAKRVVAAWGEVPGSVA